MVKPTVGIIGTGVVGSAIGIALRSKGYLITGVADQVLERRNRLADRLGTSGMLSTEAVRQAEVVFITTNDGAIGQVTRELAKEGCFQSGQAVIHMSGALTSEVLEPAAKQGAVCLSVHPLQSFAATEQALQVLPGSVFSIEGNPAGYSLAINLVEDLAGKYFFIDKKAKPLYHAGACVVSNYLVTLIDFGTHLLEAAGIPKETAATALFPLIEGTLNNIRKVGIPQALTGPIARGDLATIREHITTMEGVAPDLVSLYRSLGSPTVEVAERKGSITGERAQELQNILR